ncbi:MAG TPA: HEAT repeat domain-containing protein, partial [Anaerolineae bacterium]|nr:HEAT repeat domain-containing protein [Anaerolineae bacterium]
VLAYGEVAPEALPRGGSMTELRQALLDSYVARMVAREAERRAKGGGTGRVRYGRAQLERYLGWLAVTLSVRSQTILPVRGLYRFLVTQVDEDWQDNSAGVVNVVNGLALFLMMVGVGWGLSPVWPRGLGVVVIMSGGMMTWYWILQTILVEGRKVRKKYDDEISVKESMGQLGQWLGLVIGLLGGTVFLFAGFLLNWAVISVYWLFFSFVLTLMQLSGEWGTDIPIVSKQQNRWQRPWEATDEKTDEKIALDIDPSKIVTLRALMWGVMALVGGVVGGVQGAMLSYFLVVGVLMSFDVMLGLIGFLMSRFDSWQIRYLNEKSRLWGWIQETYSINGRLERKVSVGCYRALWYGFAEVVMSPLLWMMLVVTGKLPWRTMAFGEYLVDTLLVKRVYGDYQFGHRLLRDYFAMKALVPDLAAAENAAERVAVIERLGRQGESAAEVLVDLLASEEAEVRAAAVAGLARIGTPEVVGVLKGHMEGEGAAEVRVALLRTLSKVQRRDKDYFVYLMLRDKRVAVQVAVAQDAYNGDTESSAYLLFWFLTQNDGQTNRQLLSHWADNDGKEWRESGIVGHLAEQMTDDIIDQLVILAMDAEAGLRQLATALLAQIEASRLGGVLVKGLDDEDLFVCLNCIEGLGKLGLVGTKEALLARYGQRKRWSWALMKEGTRELGWWRSIYVVDWYIVRALAQMGAADNERDFWYGLLSHRVPKIRIEAVRVWSRWDVGDEGEVLAKMLADKDASVRHQAIQAVGDVGGRQHIPLLVNLLGKRPSWGRFYVTNAIKKLGTKDDISLLASYLKAADREVRRDVVGLIGQLGDKDAVPLLAQMAEDRDRYVRWAVAKEVGHLGGSEAIPILRKMLADKEAEVREVVVDTLASIGDKQVSFILLTMLNDENHRVRRTAVEGVVKVGDKNDSRLWTELLQSEDKIVFSNTVEALLRGEPEVTKPLLMPTLLEKLVDESEGGQWQIVSYMARLGDKRFVAEWIRLLKNKREYWHRQIVRVVQKMTDESYIPLWESLLFDDNGVDFEDVLDILKVVPAKSDKIVDYLWPLLDSSGEKRQELIINVLGNMGRYQDGLRLLKRLDDYPVGSRPYVATIVVVGKLKVREAVPILGSLLREPKVMFCQNEIIKALHDIGEITAIPYLKAVLGEAPPLMHDYVGLICTIIILGGKEEKDYLDLLWGKHSILIGQILAVQLCMEGDDKYKGFLSYWGTLGGNIDILEDMFSVFAEYFYPVYCDQMSYFVSPRPILRTLITSQHLPELEAKLPQQSSRLRALLIEAIGGLGDLAGIPIVEPYLQDRAVVNIGDGWWPVNKYAREALVLLRREMIMEESNFALWKQYWDREVW